MAVPPTLHAQMEVAKAIGSLAAEEAGAAARRRAVLSPLRRELEEIPALLRSTLAEWRSELLDELRKYNADEPRVPKGNPHGGEWTKEENDAPRSAASISGSNRPRGIVTSKSPRQYAERDSSTRTDATTNAQPKLPPIVNLTPGQIISSYLAGAGNYISQSLTTAGYYAADALSFGAASETTDGPPNFRPFPVTSRYVAAEGAATAQGVTTVTGASGLGDAVASGLSASASGIGDATPLIEISTSRFGEAAKHAADPQAAGQPDVLTIDRLAVEANRAAATRGLKRLPGMHLDEYPPAMFKEGGAGASVRPINPADNMSMGAYIGNFCRPYPNWTKIRIRVVK